MSRVFPARENDVMDPLTPLRLPFFSGLPFHKAVAVVLSLPLSHVETGKLGTKGNGEKGWVMARKKLKGVEFPGRITSLRWTVLMPGQLF